MATTEEPKDPNRRPMGRLVLEAVAWGAGFAIGAGAMHLLWTAMTSKRDSDDDDMLSRLEDDD